MKRKSSGNISLERCTSPSIKRGKVQAQRKFAQGSNNYHFPLQKNIFKTPDNIFPSFSPLQQNSPENDEFTEVNSFSALPTVDDFLTFLCFRETEVLPVRLNYLNNPQVETPVVDRKTAIITTDDGQEIKNSSTAEENMFRGAKENLIDKQSELKLRSHNFLNKKTLSPRTQKHTLALKHNQRLRSKHVSNRPLLKNRNVCNINRKADKSVSNMCARERLKSFNDPKDKIISNNKTSKRVTRRSSILIQDPEITVKPIFKTPSILLNDSSKIISRTNNSCSNSFKCKSQRIKVAAKPNSCCRSTRTQVERVHSSSLACDTRKSVNCNRRLVRQCNLKLQKSDSAPRLSHGRRPRRHIKETGTLYMKMIGKNLRNGVKENFDDDAKLSCNIREIESDTKSEKNEHDKRFVKGCAIKSPSPVIKRSPKSSRHKVSAAKVVMKLRKKTESKSRSMFGDNMPLCDSDIIRSSVTTNPSLIVENHPLLNKKNNKCEPSDDDEITISSLLANSQSSEFCVHDRTSSILNKNANSFSDYQKTKKSDISMKVKKNKNAKSLIEKSLSFCNHGELKKVESNLDLEVNTLFNNPSKPPDHSLTLNKNISTVSDNNDRKKFEADMKLKKKMIPKSSYRSVSNEKSRLNSEDPSIKKLESDERMIEKDNYNPVTSENLTTKINTEKKTDGNPLEAKSEEIYKSRTTQLVLANELIMNEKRRKSIVFYSDVSDDFDDDINEEFLGFPSSVKMDPCKKLNKNLISQKKFGKYIPTTSDKKKCNHDVSPSNVKQCLEECHKSPESMQTLKKDYTSRTYQILKKDKPNESKNSSALKKANKNVIPNVKTAGRDLPLSNIHDKRFVSNKRSKPEISPLITESYPENCGKNAESVQNKCDISTSQFCKKAEESESKISLRQRKLNSNVGGSNDLSSFNVNDKKCVPVKKSSKFDVPVLTGDIQLENCNKNSNSINLLNKDCVSPAFQIYKKTVQIESKDTSTLKIINENLTVSCKQSGLDLHSSSGRNKELVAETLGPKLDGPLCNAEHCTENCDKNPESLQNLNEKCSLTYQTRTKMEKIKSQNLSSVQTSNKNKKIMRKYSAHELSSSCINNTKLALNESTSKIDLSPSNALHIAVNYEKNRESFLHNSLDCCTSQPINDSKKAEKMKLKDLSTLKKISSKNNFRNHLPVIKKESYQNKSNLNFLPFNPVQKINDSEDTRRIRKPRPQLTAETIVISHHQDISSDTTETVSEKEKGVSTASKIQLQAQVCLKTPPKLDDSGKDDKELFEVLRKPVPNSNTENSATYEKLTPSPCKPSEGEKKIFKKNCSFSPIGTNRKSEAFSADNENSVYAFEPDLPTQSPPFRSFKTLTPTKPPVTAPPTHNAIAVQVNFSTDSEVSATGNCADQVFYIPIPTTTASGTLGVAVKLDTDGPNQKIIMSATLITNSSTFCTSTTTNIVNRVSHNVIVSNANSIKLSSSEQGLKKSTTSNLLHETDKLSAPIEKIIPQMQSVKIVKLNKKKKFRIPRDLGSKLSESNLKSKSATTSNWIEMNDPNSNNTQEYATKSTLKPIIANKNISESGCTKNLLNNINPSDKSDSSTSSKVRKSEVNSTFASVADEKNPASLTSSSNHEAQDKVDGGTETSNVEQPDLILEAPTFRPTEEEFNDPLEYINKIQMSAEKFGLCRIIPPSNFRPECKVNDGMRFTAYDHQIHKMLHRWGPNVKEMLAIRKYLATQSIKLTQLPKIGGVEVDLPNLYRIVQQCGGLRSVMETGKWHLVADTMKIPKLAQDRVAKLDDIYCKYLLSYDILSHDEREKLFEDVEKDWIAHQQNESINDDLLDDIDECITKGRTMALSCFYRMARNMMLMCYGNTDSKGSATFAETIEQEFWKHVSERKCHICVHSASVDSGSEGFGFSVAKNSTCRKHPWNLKVLTNNSGSILRSLGPVMGITVPTLHFGMLYSTCCWYRDPHGLPWIEYLHTGASKIWYGVADAYGELFRNAVLKIVPQYCRKDRKIWLPSDTVMIPPPLLTSHKVSLTRLVQEPGQFVVVFPKAFTSSISTGYLVSEIVYFAQESWIDSSKQIFQDMHDSSEPPGFSIEQLLISIAQDVRTNLPVLQKILPMLIEMKETEKASRTLLKQAGLTSIERLRINKKRKPKNATFLPGDDYYECDTCHANLFLSLVENAQEGESYCLKHATVYLKANPSTVQHCQLVYSFTDDELDFFVETVKEKIQAKSSKKLSTTLK